MEKKAEQPQLGPDRGSQPPLPACLVGPASVAVSCQRLSVLACLPNASVPRSVARPHSTFHSGGGGWGGAVLQLSTPGGLSCHLAPGRGSRRASRCSLGAPEPLAEGHGHQVSSALGRMPCGHYSKCSFSSSASPLTLKAHPSGPDRFPYIHFSWLKITLCSMP